MHGRFASIKHLDSQGLLLWPLWDVVARDQNDHQPSSHAVDHHLTHKYTFTHITLLVDDTCLQAGMPFFHYAILCATSG